MVSLKILQDMKKEVELKRRAGPFSSLPFPNLVVSPIGAVPKKHSTKLRLIHHLSWPRDLSHSSVNESINDIECEYTSFQSVVKEIAASGKGTLLAKYDIKDAFRLLRVRPDDHLFLGMAFAGYYFYEKCIPFGIKSGPAFFESFATAINTMASAQEGIQHLRHYLDDFILFCHPDRAESDHAAVLSLFRQLGVPICEEPHKLITPRTELEFLGIVINTDSMTVRLPDDKRDRYRATIETWRKLKRGSLHDLQSLVGVLVYAARAIQHGRCFYFHNLALLREVRPARGGTGRGRRMVRLSDKALAELDWWSEFISAWNGVQIIPPTIEQFPVTRRRLITTDACMGGAGAWFPGQRKYICLPWAPEIIEMAMRRERLSMPFLELLSIVLAVYSWRTELSGLAIDLQSDCETVVMALRKGYSLQPDIHQLILSLLFITNQHQIFLSCSHIQGIKNVEADTLSRAADNDVLTQSRNLSVFFALPSVKEGPSPLQTVVSPLPSWSWLKLDASSFFAPKQWPHDERTQQP
jgi:hypothetical protein